eukprot:jgi/Chrzof1/11193/Cz05g27170.t1
MMHLLTALIVLGAFLGYCSAAPANCTKLVTAYGTCGGLASGCVGSQCRDGVWEGHCCPEGFACNRFDKWYYKCEKIPLNCTKYKGPTCNTTVPAYGACGGNASNCKGCQCKDAPWDGYCCQPGHQCNRKKPEYWKCEPAVLQCKPYTGPKCYLTVTAYATCGGLASGCSSCQCKDAPWDGYCCPAGFSCNKQNPLFWKCEKKGTAGASGNQTLAANETTMPTANGTIRVTVKRSAGP